MKFILLEDDNNWAADVEKMILSFSPAASVRRIESERKFRCDLESLIGSYYDVAILDVMVAWASVDEIIDEDALSDVPDEVEAELEGKAKWRAGLRCARLLQEKSTDLKMPCPSIIFYTVVAEKDLGDSGNDPAFIYLEKSRSADKMSQNPIGAAIHQALSNRHGILH